MTFEKWFPSALILLDCTASIVYCYDNDFRRAIYWFAAAILTATVTF